MTIIDYINEFYSDMIRLDSSMWINGYQAVPVVH